MQEKCVQLLGRFAPPPDLLTRALSLDPAGGVAPDPQHILPNVRYFPPNLRCLDKNPGSERYFIL